MKWRERFFTLLITGSRVIVYTHYAMRLSPMMNPKMLKT